MDSNFQFIDLSYLDLMADGDDEMKQTMIEMLLEEIPEEMEKMKTLQEAGNWKELREVSHKMKSTLSFIGNSIMTEANKRIEDIAKSEERLEELPNLLGILLEIYPSTLEELRLVEAAL